MKQTTTAFTAQLVTFDTSLPFDEVIARLDAAVNKPGSLLFLQRFRNAASKSEIEDLVNTTKGPNDFLYFLEMGHHKWMNIYQGTPVHPPAVVYTIGNPLLAESIVRHDLRAGYAIPPRIMVLGAPTGTTVLYHLPSSLVPHAPAEMQVGLAELDAKLERLIARVTAD